MIKGLVFDLDGTLLDTVGDLAEAMNVTRVHFGLGTLSIDEVARALGNGIRVLVKTCLPEDFQPRLTEALTVFHQAYAQGYNNNSKPYPGIPELLEILHTRGLPMAVVTNKAEVYAKALVQAHFPKIPFVLVRGETEGQTRKPDPEGILEAAKLMGLSPAEIVLIGDTEVDKASADNAGCAMWGVSWGFRSVSDLEKAGVTTLLYHANDCILQLDKV